MKKAGEVPHWMDTLKYLCKKAFEEEDKKEKEKHGIADEDS